MRGTGTALVFCNSPFHLAHVCAACRNLFEMRVFLFVMGSIATHQPEVAMFSCRLVLKQKGWGAWSVEFEAQVPRPESTQSLYSCANFDNLLTSLCFSFPFCKPLITAFLLLWVFGESRVTAFELEAWRACLHIVLSVILASIVITSYE